MALRKKWYIYGAGGFGAETIDILSEMLSHNNSAIHECEFLVDEPDEKLKFGFQVTDFREAVAGSHVTIAVGEPSLRKKLYNKAQGAGLILSSVVSPKAHVSDLCNIGNGAIIAPFCSVQATASVGINVALNTASIIGHDAEVGDGCVISSMANLGGSVKLGAGSFCGMGALIKEGVIVGKSSIIGMGSVLYNDVPDNVIALGSPARVVRKNERQQVFGR